MITSYLQLECIPLIVSTLKGIAHFMNDPWTKSTLQWTLWHSVEVNCGCLGPSPWSWWPGVWKWWLVIQSGLVDQRPWVCRSLVWENIWSACPCLRWI